MSLFALEKGIATLFTSDGVLPGLIPGGVHKGVRAPGSASGRYLVFSWQSDPADRHTAGTDNGFLDGVLFARVIEEGYDAEAADLAMQRAHALLVGDDALALAGLTALPYWHVMGVHREKALSYAQAEGDRVFQYVGGLYRVLAQRITS